MKKEQEDGKMRQNGTKNVFLGLHQNTGPGFYYPQKNSQSAFGSHSQRLLEEIYLAIFSHASKCEPLMGGQDKVSTFQMILRHFSLLLTMQIHKHTFTG